MTEFMGMEPQDQCMVVVDPSAASFITELRSRGLYVKPPIMRWQTVSVWLVLSWLKISGSIKITARA